MVGCRPLRRRIRWSQARNAPLGGYLGVRQAHRRRRDVSALWRAYLGWRTAAGPLADFVLPTPFLAAREPAPRTPRHPLAVRLADGLTRREARARVDAGRAIVFLEAPPRLALSVALYLRRRGWRVAPAFGRWALDGAVLPGEPLAAWLSGAPGSAMPSLTDGDTDALCVLLDAERRRRVPASALRRRFDNRYEYGAQMLPPPERLRGWGVVRVLWAGPAAALAPDLQGYADSLVSAGLTTELVRLADLGSRT